MPSRGLSTMVVFRIEMSVATMSTPLGLLPLTVQLTILTTSSPPPVTAPDLLAPVIVTPSIWTIAPLIT